MDVTSPLTASATCASPVLTATLPSLRVTVSVTVAVCVDHVQPAPQSPHPPHPSPPAPPIHGLPLHAHPVTVKLAPVNVEPQAPPHPAAPPPPPWPLPGPKPPPPLSSKRRAGVVVLGDAVPVPVPVVQGSVYTPVLPALEHDDHASQSEEARLLYEATAVGVALQAEERHEETEEKEPALQKAVGEGQEEEARVWEA